METKSSTEDGNGGKSQRLYSQSTAYEEYWQRLALEQRYWDPASGKLQEGTIRGGLKLRHTNFSRKMALYSRDIENISQKMDSIVSLADAILPCVE